MKAALFLLLFTLAARAVPVVHVDFVQDNWAVAFRLYALDESNNQVFGTLFINSDGQGGTERSLIGLLPASGVPNFPFQLGLNTTHVIIGGVDYIGPSFTIVAPTGLREFPAGGWPPPGFLPVSVPEGGNTLLLLGVAVLVLWLVRRHFIAA